MDKLDVIEDQNVKSEGEETERSDDLLNDENIIQIVSFSLLNDVEYGVDILSIHEILRIPEITRLPNTPPYIKGVINLRGNVIPVVSVRGRFGLPETQLTESSRIIVVSFNEKLIGLLVNDVFQVVRIPKRNIDLPSELIEGVSAEFIEGVGRLKDRLIVLLKLDNMLFTNGNED